MEADEYSAAEADSYITMDHPLMSKKSKNDPKRRFSEEQVKSLETIFESHATLEPRKKLQLARELGLQPRQVAIWFQNKRARWKSKQLEREYHTLRADYDALLTSFESLKKEKQNLAKQLQNLAELLEKPPEKSSTDGDSDDGDVKSEENRKHSLLMTEGSDLRFKLSSDDEVNKMSYLSEEEKDIYVKEPAGDSLTSSELQDCCLDPKCFPDQSCTSSQWWDFWPLNE